MSRRILEEFLVAYMQQLPLQNRNAQPSCIKRVYLREKLKQKNYEGKHGKRELKRLFRKGIQYNEVKHGPELFEIVRFAVAEKNSPSFKEFTQYLGRS